MRAIKDGRLDIELKSRGPNVEVVSLCLRLVSLRLEKNSKSHSRTMFTIPCSRKYSSDTHHPSYALLWALGAVLAGSIFDNVAQSLLHDRRNNHLTLTDLSLTAEMVYGVVDDIHSKRFGQMVQSHQGRSPLPPIG